MTKNDVLTALAEAFHEVGNVDAAAVRPEASLFTDLNIDSMVIAEALILLEQRFGLEVGDEFADGLSTVDDLAEHVLANSARV
ncbi:acyl carrier protein [Kitasatospora sp. NPDC048239]|uniref:acyl carrier protein n=1 Tax=unclassified Kitasatospora TaxID=2633591 RepID=UPI0036D981A9